MTVQTVDAIVQTGALATPYVRAGHGPPLILLRESSTPLHDDVLFQQLAAQFRVIVPALECCAAASSPGSWLRDLSDGLGLDQPCIVICAANEQELSVLLARMQY